VISATRIVFAGTMLAVPLLAAACGASSIAPPTAPVVAPATGAPAVEAPATGTVPSEPPSEAPGSMGAPGPTPGGADVTGIDACALITQAEAEAALGVATKPPFGGGTPDVNIRSCMYQSTDGNGPQVGIAVSGAPDAFRPAAAASVPDLGDEAWWWLDPSRGFRLEVRDGDRFIAFEFNDFRTSDKPTEAALGALVPLMRTALSRLPAAAEVTNACTEEPSAERDIQVDGTPARIVAAACQGPLVYEATLVRDGVGFIAKQITPPPGSQAEEEASIDDFLSFLDPFKPAS
jgi:hypothetical protein